ncbi:ATP-binding cassette domain-containing protein [Laceyella putida]|uniref:ATP-binding cassette domain-containing protein n=1 Tax=Laceyella putida TaxID=110101 RepID=A0ABW2RQG9_9BACL
MENKPCPYQRKYDLQWIHRHVSFISQEPYLFHATIRENIAYGKSHATMEEIVQAAKKAQIHHVIMKMPKQYDTVVGERGYKLSTGEKQRVALDGLFIIDSKIVILDEVTSALDAISGPLLKVL